MKALDFTVLPAAIAEKLKSREYTADSIGESGAGVFVFADSVLKIEKTAPSSDNEHTMLLWLGGRLPVPRVLAFERSGGFNYLLMTRLDGEMACSEGNIRCPGQTVRALADGLLKLWSIDISDCPVKNGLDEKLRTARYNIDNGLVDIDDMDDGTLGSGGFTDVEALYRFLCENRPDEDFVLSHGDYCLPNVFIGGARTVGMLDMGSSGIADRWSDIALCVRSMKYNFDRHCIGGDAEYAEYTKLLFDELKIKPDEVKIRYYTLLDELF